MCIYINNWCDIKGMKKSENSFTEFGSRAYHIIYHSK